jgi:hypothetical protein
MVLQVLASTLIDVYYNKKREVIEQKSGGASYLAASFYSSPSFSLALCAAISLLLLHSTSSRRGALLTHHLAEPFRAQYHACNCRWSKVIVCCYRINPQFYLVINDVYVSSDIIDRSLLQRYSKCAINCCRVCTLMCYAACLKLET